MRYAGSYAGSVVFEGGHYRCAVNLRRKGEWILQAVGGSDSLEGAARDVAHHYWLSNIWTRLGD